MRRTRQIYKRRSRSNLETLIILIGAIIILSVAFYMAREKSFLPPEDNQLGQDNVFEEKIAKNETTDQVGIEKLPVQDGLVNTNMGDKVESKTSDQTEIIDIKEEVLVSKEEELLALLKEQPLQHDPNIAENPVKKESEIISEQNKLQIEEASSGTVFTVQVGYFSVESNARSLAEKIKNQGFQTFVFKQKNAYKVQVGAYKDRIQAEKASQELKSLGYEIWITQR